MLRATGGTTVPTPGAPGGDGVKLQVLVARGSHSRWAGWVVDVSTYLFKVHIISYNSRWL